MDFIEYKTLLNNNNIYLFDHEYRISYNKILNNNYINNKFINNFYKNQMGGGQTSYLNNIVKISLSSNPQYLYNII